MTRSTTMFLVHNIRNTQRAGRSDEFGSQAREICEVDDVPTTSKTS